MTYYEKLASLASLGSERQERQEYHSRESWRTSIRERNASKCEGPEIGAGEFLNREVQRVIDPLGGLTFSRLFAHLRRAN